MASRLPGGTAAVVGAKRTTQTSRQACPSRSSGATPTNFSRGSVESSQQATCGEARRVCSKNSGGCRRSRHGEHRISLPGSSWVRSAAPVAHRSHRVRGKAARGLSRRASSCSGEGGQVTPAYDFGSLRRASFAAIGRRLRKSGAEGRPSAGAWSVSIATLRMPDARRASWSTAGPAARASQAPELGPECG
jgi:hypothetical protein